MCAVQICPCSKLVRSQVIFANTMFCSVCYRPDECQVITVGTDRKASARASPAAVPHVYLPLQIGYWETYDGGQIRELDGSQSASINGMDICGTRFVTGGGDKLMKVSELCSGPIALLILATLLWHCRCGTTTVGR